MPTYSFECQECQKVFEVFMTFGEYDKKPKVVCDKCGSVNVSRNYVEDALNVNMSVKKSDSELKTLGDLAKRNNDRLSDDEKVNIHHKHNEYKDPVYKSELPKGMSRIKKPSKKFKWR